MAIVSARHQGGCCGMRTAYSFGRPNAEGIRQLEAKMLDYDDAGHRGNILLEVVLTDQQLNQENGEWVRQLRRHNFRRVSRFLNSNSGNICNVFHYIPNRIRPGEDENVDPWRVHRARRAR
jgi:hypothetical protein